MSAHQPTTMLFLSQNNGYVVPRLTAPCLLLASLFCGFAVFEYFHFLDPLAHLVGWDAV